MRDSNEQAESKIHKQARFNRQRTGTRTGQNGKKDTDTMRNRCADNQQNRQRQQVTGEGAGKRSPWSTKQTEAHGDKKQKEAAEHTAYDMQINLANLIT